MIALILDNQPADLPTDAASQIRLNAPDYNAAQLTGRVGERSYPMVLPATRANDRIFQHARQLPTPGKFVRATEMQARLTVDGVDVLGAGGVCRLSRAGAGGYTVVLYAAGVSVLDLLAEKTLQDIASLPAVALTSVADLQDLCESDRSTCPLAFVLTAYGNFFSGGDGANPSLAAHYIDTPLELDDVVPGVYALSALEALFQDVGYRVEGPMFQDEYWNRLAIPYTGPVAPPFNYGTLAVATGKCDTAEHPTYDVDTLSLLREASDAVTVTSIDASPPPGGWSVAMTVRLRYTCPAAGTYRVHFSFDALAGTPFPDVYFGVRVVDGDGLPFTLVPGIFQGAAGAYDTYGVGNFPGMYVDLVVAQGETIEFLVYDTNTLGDVAVPASVDIQVVPQDLPLTLAPAGFLPPMPQRDFLKAFLFLTNSDLYVDASRRVVRFAYRDGISAAEALTAVPLDSVMDPAALSYDPASLFKAVAFQYTADSSDAAAAEGLGSSTFTMQLAGRTETKVVTVPFAPTAVRYYTTTPDGGSGAFYLPTIASDTALETARAESVWTCEYAPHLLVAGELMNVAHGIRVGGRDPVAVRFRLSSPDELAFGGTSGLIQRRYKAMLENLLTGELATGTLPLTPALYRQIADGARVVKLAGALFRVQKLEGYLPASTKPATITLLRYLPVSGRF